MCRSVAFETPVQCHPVPTPISYVVTRRSFDGEKTLDLSQFIDRGRTPQCRTRTEHVPVAAGALADARDQGAADYRIPDRLRHSRKQDLAIDVGLGLRTPRRMANIAELENMRRLQSLKK